MVSERDLSDLLPPVPQPRPDRREAAIGAALRRFDGAPDPSARTASPAHRWRLTARPQIGMFAAAALVAAIGLPLWLSGERQPTAAIAPPAAIASRVQTDAVAEPASDLAASAPVNPPTIVTPPPPASAAPAAAPEAADMAAPVGAPQAAAPPAEVSLPSQRAEYTTAAAPPPFTDSSRRDAESASNATADIVVTSARVSDRTAKPRQNARPLARRGDWNRCTIDDPRQNISACRPRARASASTSASPAAESVAEGLTAAWRGDFDSAVAAFDRAIAVSPRFAAAWLNRGLALARAGDDARALADLDRAIRYAPDDARGWFQRSLILRRTGSIARADADAARAVELDRRYEDGVD